MAATFTDQGDAQGNGVNIGVPTQITSDAITDHTILLVTSNEWYTNSWIVGLKTLNFTSVPVGVQIPKASYGSVRAFYGVDTT